MGRIGLWFFAGLAALAGCGPERSARGGPGSPDDGSPTSQEPYPTGTPDPTDPPGTTVVGAPTWYQDVAPLLADRCGSCHVTGGIAPFTVADYETAKTWGYAIEDAVLSGRMPPFFARNDALCEERLAWKEDLRLSDDEKALISDWVAAEMPEGDPEEAAPAPLREVDDLDTWDAELALQEPFAVGGTGDIYQCFRLPMPNTDDIWLTGVQVVPDSSLTVHHVLVWNDPYDNSEGLAGDDGTYGCSGFPDLFPTELVAAWTPGAQPVRSPADTGTLVHAGASLVLNIHYHPTGTTTELDQSRVRLQWRTTRPAQYTTWYLADIPFGAFLQPGPDDVGGPEFRIPANDPDHVETNELWIPPLLFPDMPVFAVAPHMHFLGTDQLVTLDHKDPQEPDECLVHTPGYRFDFQQGYVFDPASGPLPVIHPGDRVRVQCRYDNTTDNPFMPLHLAASGASEPHDVEWGEETGDEMCMAMLGLILPPVDWMELFAWL